MLFVVYIIHLINVVYDLTNRFDLTNHFWSFESSSGVVISCTLWDSYFV